MLKIMACLERPTEKNCNDWSMEINEFLTSRLGDFRACQYTIEDEHTEAAADIRLENTLHPKNAIISIWVDHAYSLDDFYTDLGALCHYQAYGVIETRTMPFKQQVGHTSGFCQTSFLTKPNSLSHQQWLDRWLGDSTQVSARTQSSYSLTQNVITVTLPFRTQRENSWILLGGIAQDYFMNDAMRSRQAFYAAHGDEQKYLDNEQELISSALKFIDFDHFDCVPMSQYIIKAGDW